MRTYHLPVIHDWADWRSIFTDSALWRPLIEEIWASDSALPTVTGVKMPARVEAGYPGTCAVFIVNRRAVVKLFPPMIPHDFEKERTDQDLRSGEQVNILKELGGIIRAVHAVPLPPAGDWPSLGAWQLLVDARLPLVADELRQQTALSPQIIEEIDRLLVSIDWSAYRPCLCHADLTEDHLLLSQESGRWQIAGLIDWADVEVAPPFYEWVTLWFSICRRRRDLFDAFLAGYDERSLATEISAGQMLSFTFLHRFGAVILNDTLSPEEQRAIGSLRELEQRLFPRLLN